MNPLIAFGAAGAVLLFLGVLWNRGWLDLSRYFGDPVPPTSGLVAVPTPARPIPAYTRITRDHFWDARTNQLTVVYLPPRAVTREMLVNLPAVLGRVLNHEKAPGYVFTESDFLPRGTREGLVGGIPAGKRALRVPSDQVDGLFGLHAGDRFDIVATMPIDEGRGGGGQTFGFSGVYSQQMALEARLSNWQKQATVHVIVQSGVIVEPLATRQVPVAATTNGARVRPVQDVVIAVDPDEVARLTEALTVQAKIWMVPRSGHPDDPPISTTPDLRPVSPFAGGQGATAYRMVETIMGQKRELTAVPRP